MDDATLRTADAQSWALNRLGTKPVPGETPTQTALRSITESNYHVTDESILALRTFVGQLPISEFVYRAGRQERLEKTVADFAVQFFEYTSDARCRKIQQLNEDCRGIYTLTCWLDDLSRGVTIEALPRSEDPHFNNLVDSCCKAFVAKSLSRVRKFQDLAERCRTLPQWKTAFEELCTNHIIFVHCIAPWGLELFPASQTGRKQTLLVDGRKVGNANVRGFLFVSCLTALWIYYFITFDRSTRMKTGNDANRPLAARTNAADTKATNGERAKSGSSLVIDRTDFFGSFAENFPDIFEKFCQEVPGLRECQSDRAKRKLLNNFAISIQTDIESYVRSKFEDRPAWSWGVLKTANGRPLSPNWLLELEIFASKLAMEQIKSTPATEYLPPVFESKKVSERP